MLAVAMLVVGPWVSIASRQQAWETWFAGRPNALATGARLIVDNTGNVLIFGILFATAVYCRRRRVAHKRLMLLACLAIMKAPITRIIDLVGSTRPAMVALNSYGMLNLVVLPFYLALAIYDYRTLGRLHPATASGGLLIFFLQAVAKAVLDVASA